MNEKIIIDRFEGDFAICEKNNAEFIKILRENLPENIHEGDCLVKIEDDYVVDTEVSKKAKERIEKKLNDLFCD